MAATGARRSMWAQAVAFALLCLALVPAKAAEPQPGAISGEILWTDRPVRIDRSKQTYERIAVAPIPIPLRIEVSRRAVVFDGGSFEDRGRLYVLTDMVPVDPDRLCRGMPGAIAVCGQQARIALRRRIAGRSLFCMEDHRSGRLSFVTCRVDGRDLAATLVALGTGWAATPRLEAMQEEALRERRGIWIDAQCRAAGRCLPSGDGRP